MDWKNLAQGTKENRKLSTGIIGLHITCIGDSVWAPRNVWISFNISTPLFFALLIHFTKTWLTWSWMLCDKSCEMVELFFTVFTYLFCTSLIESLHFTKSALAFFARFSLCSLVTLKHNSTVNMKHCSTWKARMERIISLNFQSIAYWTQYTKTFMWLISTEFLNIKSDTSEIPYIDQTFLFLSTVLTNTARS